MRQTPAPSPASRHSQSDVLAVIDIGTNAVRLEIAKVLPNGVLDVIHQERDPIRPGEGVFLRGQMEKTVVNRLVATLSRYAELCRRYRAHVRAVATSAIREAKNRADVLRQVSKASGLSVEVISGLEEARLVCLGVLSGAPSRQHALCIDIGGGSTELAWAMGSQPKHLWSIPLGAVRLTEMFDAKEKVSKRKRELMRYFAAEAVQSALPSTPPRAFENILGSSGTIQAVVKFASAGASHVTRKEISAAIDELSHMSWSERAQHFEARRADVIVAGAIILEAVLERWKLKSVSSVDRGLREGVLQDLSISRTKKNGTHSTTDEAISVGRRFGFSEDHARHVAFLSLALFDGLQKIHRLPSNNRILLEVAALLHDIGHVVNYQRHHKHSQYLIQNSELPGLTDEQLQVSALIARFHRRSEPDDKHEAMQGLGPEQRHQVKICATLLRLADALDRSHHQRIKNLSVYVTAQKITLTLKATGPIDLELWDAQHEVTLFGEIFDRPLYFKLPLKHAKTI